MNNISYTDLKILLSKCPIQLSSSHFPPCVALFLRPLAALQVFLQVPLQPGLKKNKNKNTQTKKTPYNACEEQKHRAANP